MSKIKVLIVDDSFSARQAITEVLSSANDIEVIAAAPDAMAAAAHIRDRAPDVILLDIEMPHMDGLTFLHMVMCLKPIPVVICSSQAGRPRTAMMALDYGAVEVVVKPPLNAGTFGDEAGITLCDAIRAAARARLKVASTVFAHRKQERAEEFAAEPAKGVPLPSGVKDTVIVVGASTGGTDALRTVLAGLPAEAPGVLVVQHMPEKFTYGFAERLNGSCKMRVKEAEDNDRVARGQVLLAPGNRHMLLKRDKEGFFVEVKDGPLVSRHRPSVDVLFRSTARYAGRNAIGVILTGMGNDGAAGMKEMKDAGAFNIAQDEATCIVFGMPHEAVKNGGVDIVLPLSEIASKLTELCKKRG